MCDKKISFIYEKIKFGPTSYIQILRLLEYLNTYLQKYSWVIEILFWNFVTEIPYIELTACQQCGKYK